MAFSRQESVTDEDLFGAGRLEVEKSSRASKTPDIVANNLPDFSLLGLKSNDDETEGFSGEVKDQEISHSIVENRKRNSEDFQTVFRSKGSISTLEGKRHKFHLRSDIEVFEDDEMYAIAADNPRCVVRKSNSLPDLVLSSSSPLSPSSTLPSYNSSVPLPSSGAGDLEDRKSKKEAFEGKSTCLGKQKIPTVGFKSGADTIIEVLDEGFDEQSNDESGNKQKGKDKGSVEMRDSDGVSKRRELYSRSSGYQTGSESQEKSKSHMQSQTSTVASSDLSSEHWMSREHEKIDEDLSANGFNFGGNIPNIDQMMSATNTGESYSSQGTVVGSKGQMSQYSPQEEQKKTSCSETTAFSVEFKRLKTESYSEDNAEVAPNKGNVPNIDRLHDSSVCLGQSTINQIEIEADEKLKRTAQQIREGILPPQGSLLTINDPRSSITDPWLNEYQREVLENCLKTGLDPSVILKKFQESESSTPSPSPADISRIISPGQKFTSVCLEKASRCHKKDCSEKACDKFAVINKILEKEILTEDSEYERVKQYCEALCLHHRECEELWCKVLYCQILDKWVVCANDVKKMIDCIQKAVKDPVMSVLPSDTYTFQMVRDQDRFRNKNDVESLIPLSKLGTFGSALLCMDKTQQLCVVKDYAMFDYRHQLSLYDKLREKHPYIVDQLWILEQEDIIQVCSDFMPGGSLYDYIQSFGPLTWQKVMIYVQQMLSALTFLHKNGIVYLNWQSRNMLFKDTTYQRIKLTNFTLSCPLGVQYDMGAVKQCLLPNIIPPELLQNSVPSLLSDIWGVGCMVFELLVGEGVWSKFKHESREYIHKKISGKVPNFPVNLPDEQNKVFKACWKVNPDRRYTTDKLYDYITSCLQNDRIGH